MWRQGEYRCFRICYAVLSRQGGIYVGYVPQFEPVGWAYMRCVGACVCP